MNKLTLGFISLILVCAGCNSKLSVNEEVQRLKYHHTGIEKTLNLQKGDSCGVIEDRRSGFYGIVIKNDHEVKFIRYLDSDDDGKYDKKIISIDFLDESVSSFKMQD